MAGPSWALLPSVLIVESLSYLSRRDRLRASSTCKRWRSCLFQAKLLPSMNVDMGRKYREKTNFFVDVCGRFVRECVIKFQSHNPDEVIECFKLLHVLTENRNLQVLQLEPSSCHMEWPTNLTCSRFVHALEDIISSSRRLKHFSIGHSEELLEHSSSILERLSHSHATTLQSLHLASVKGDSQNYGIIDLDIQDFRRFSNLRHLSIDYDFIDNQFLDILSMNTQGSPLEHLCINVHGIHPEHEKITNVSWRHLASRYPNLQVTLNLMHSFVGALKLLDILQPHMPLTHFRQFFCSHVNVPALALMSAHYGSSLRSIHIVDGFDGDIPLVYNVYTDEDPFVMLAWKCLKLEQITLVGYEVLDNDLIAIARLRGKRLKSLNVPSSCIRWLAEEEEGETTHQGGNEQQFSNMISASLGRSWQPLGDDDLPEAVFDEWADAELAYNSILLNDQKYKYM